jgi:hypothetical protein
MAYAENTKIKNNDGQIINPAENENITLLKRIFQLLKPLSIISGAGQNRLNVDVNAVGTVTAVTTVSTVTTVTGVTGVTGVTNVTTLGTLNNLGNIPAFDLMKASSRTAYNTGVRSNIN